MRISAEQHQANIDSITELAKKGKRISEIADDLEMEYDYVRQIISRNDIPCVKAPRIKRKVPSKKIDPTSLLHKVPDEIRSIVNSSWIINA